MHIVSLRDRNAGDKHSQQNGAIIKKSLGFMARRIQAIDRASVHRICSGQVVLDLAAAVKELVENSLDAGATSIEIKLKEYGAEAIEVADNGCGIAPENYQGLTLKYHTSKISDFSDLQALTSFGFRGEALSSLCALADLSILTRSKNEEAGTRLTYDRSGRITSQECSARTVGTTVYVEKIFKPLPVRHKEFSKNIRREYGRMLCILQAYALIAKDVRLLCTNQLGKNRSKVFSTQGKGSIRDNIVTVFGSKTLECLDALSISLSEEMLVEGFVSKPGSGSGRASCDRQYFYLNGRPVEMPKISKLLNELYRSFNSQQYPMAILNFQLPSTKFDVNVTPDKRKVFLHGEGELLSTLRQALGNLYAPDKYTFPAQSATLPADSSATSPVNELIDYETQREMTFEETLYPAVEHTEENEEFRSETPPAVSDKLLDLRSFCCESSTKSKIVKTPQGVSGKKHVQAKLGGFVSQLKRRGEDSALLTEQPVLKKYAMKPLATRRNCKSIVERGNSVVISDEEQAVVRSAVMMETDAENEVVGGLLTKTSNSHLTEEPVLQRCPGASSGAPAGCGYQQAEDLEAKTAIDSPGVSHFVTVEDISLTIRNGSQDAEHAIMPHENIEENPDGSMLQETTEETSENCKQDSIVEKTIIEEKTQKASENGENNSRQETDVTFDIEKLRSMIHSGRVRYRGTEPTGSRPKTRAFKAATVNAEVHTEMENAKAAGLAAATRELEKSFNKADFKRMKVLGQFNLGFILGRLGSDLFIIDQHASDEKYNFERLSKSTVLNRQPLLRPLRLELSAAEEVTVSTYLETFRRTGFDFVEKEDAPPGQRFQLSAVPFSKNLTFGVQDVQEMLALLSSGTSKSDVQPSRVRAMLASRACRSSIMIGDALSQKEMEKVVCHLSELDAPWNCPHGRPTMRHLFDLDVFRR